MIDRDFYIRETQRAIEPVNFMNREFGLEVRFDADARMRLAELWSLFSECSQFRRLDNEQISGIDGTHILSGVIGNQIARICELLTNEEEYKALDAITRAQEASHCLHYYLGLLKKSLQPS